MSGSSRRRRSLSGACPRPADRWRRSGSICWTSFEAATRIDARCSAVCAVRRLTRSFASCADHAASGSDTRPNLEEATDRAITKLFGAGACNRRGPQQDSVGPSPRAVPLVQWPQRNHRAIALALWHDLRFGRGADALVFKGCPSRCGLLRLHRLVEPALRNSAAVH